MNNGLGAEIIEENNYYPFGLKHGTGSITGNPATDMGTMVKNFRKKQDGMIMEQECI